ncbi:hypothetical protein GW17_00009918 [Ensete ventricosum]|nr:hypothetical protein GW17_00009918 [Ensete ventricosum]
MYRNNRFCWFGSVQFGSVTINFDRHWSISSGINRGRKKKREHKKREKMEISRSGAAPLRVISSPCAGRTNEATFGRVRFDGV